MTSVLDRTVGFLANRLDRRGFLGKSAVVGSAIVAAPLDFGLRPTSAYAAVCNCSGSNCPCGSMCCDGYTEFCCTLTGSNSCPSGTITAGWWKVDGSQFCGGAARYYLDCNAQCGSCGCGSNGVCAGSCSGTGCGCAGGSCGTRKAGCTRFRYGQCHQNVRCVGPIVCRVVTCTPPWQFDPACGTSSRTDNATRNHDKPCLQEPQGSLNAVTDLGTSRVRVQGWAVDADDFRHQTLIRAFIDNKLVGESSANIPRADVAAAYPAFGPNHGFDFQVPAVPGKRLVCLYALDRSNGRQTFLGFREVVVQGPLGSIDRVIDLGGGKVRVIGWAYDRTKPNEKATVIYTVDGAEMGRYLTNMSRPDVVRAVPNAHPQSGFQIDLTVRPGQRRICVNVLTGPGPSVPLGCVAATVGPTPLGSLDSLTPLGGGQVRVRGWAADPTKGTAPVQVNIRVGTTVVATFAAQASRPDVGAAYPSYGSNHGIDRVITLPAGTANVCIETIHNAGSVTRIGCNSVDVTA